MGHIMRALSRPAGVSTGIINSFRSEFLVHIILAALINSMNHRPLADAAENVRRQSGRGMNGNAEGVVRYIY